MQDPSEASEDAVHLAVPARASFLRLLRVTAATAAAEHGCCYDHLDDVRLAIGELAAAVMDAARRDATLHVDLELTADGLAAHGRVLARDGSASLTDVGRLLLGTVADEHWVGREGDEVVFDLRMGLPTPHAQG